MKKNLLPICIASLFLSVFSCKNEEPKKENDQTVSMNKETAEKILKAFESGKLEDFDSLIAPNAKEHTPPDPKMKTEGPEAIKEEAKMFHDAFPDMKFEVKHIVAQGDMVAVYSTMTGTNTGAMMGTPATNKAVKVDNADFMRFENGKAVDHWGTYDSYGMMMQLGLVPNPADSMKTKNNTKEG